MVNFKSHPIKNELGSYQGPWNNKADSCLLFLRFVGIKFSTHKHQQGGQNDKKKKKKKERHCKSPDLEYQDQLWNQRIDWREFQSEVWLLASNPNSTPDSA
jgi:hypothetical protein